MDFRKPFRVSVLSVVALIVVTGCDRSDSTQSNAKGSDRSRPAEPAVTAAPTANSGVGPGVTTINPKAATVATGQEKSLDDEAIQRAMKHFLDHWTTSGDSYYSMVNRDGDLRIDELRSPRPYFPEGTINSPLTEADRLNGIEYRKIVFFDYGAIRSITKNTGWSEWTAPDRSGLKRSGYWWIEVTRKNGEWAVTPWGALTGGEPGNYEDAILHRTSVNEEVLREITRMPSAAEYAAQRQEGERRAQSAENLYKLFDAIQNYALEHRMSYPQDLAELDRLGYLDPHTLVSPRTGTKLPALPADAQERSRVVNGIGDYIYIRGSGRMWASGEERIWAHENPERVKGAVLVLLSSMQVESVPLSEIAYAGGQLKMPSTQPISGPSSQPTSKPLNGEQRGFYMRSPTSQPTPGR